MARRIIFGVVFAVLIVLAYFGYNSWKTNRAMLSGEVTAGPSEPLEHAESTKLDQPFAIQPSEPAAEQAPLPSTKITSPAMKVAAPADPVATNVPVSAPATDTIAPDPPNGMAFSGTGRFQIYRQGNLTWRLNTDTGKTCILFATNEEWRKPRVYEHGCGSSASK